MEHLKGLEVWSEADLKAMSVDELQKIYKVSRGGAGGASGDPNLSPPSFVGMPVGGAEKNLESGATPKFAQLPGSIFDAGNAGNGNVNGQRQAS